MRQPTTTTQWVCKGGFGVPLAERIARNAIARRKRVPGRACVLPSDYFITEACDETYHKLGKINSAEGESHLPAGGSPTCTCFFPARDHIVCHSPSDSYRLLPPVTARVSDSPRARRRSRPSALERRGSSMIQRDPNTSNRDADCIGPRPHNANQTDKAGKADKASKTDKTGKTGTPDKLTAHRQSRAAVTIQRAPDERSPRGGQG
jgi:hypothetical protein